MGRPSPRFRPLGRCAAAVGLGTAVALAGAGPAAAAPALDDVDATVTIDDGGAAQVELVYSVTGGADEATVADVLTFSALDFSGAAVADVDVLGSDGRPLPVDVETAGLKTRVTVSLPAPLAVGQSVSLSVIYKVPRAAEIEDDELTATVPMLTLDNPAPAATSGVFRAALELPPGYSFVEGFPARTTTASSSDGGSTVLHYDVPAAPAVLQVLATSGAAPWFTVTRVMEGSLLVLLVGGGLAFYAYFARMRNRAPRAGAPAQPTAPQQPMERVQ